MDGMIFTLPRPPAGRERARRAAHRAAKLREEAMLWRDLAQRQADRRQALRMLRWASACDSEAAAVEASLSGPPG